MKRLAWWLEPSRTDQHCYSDQSTKWQVSPVRPSDLQNCCKICLSGGYNELALYLDWARGLTPHNRLTSSDDNNVSHLTHWLDICVAWHLPPAFLQGSCRYLDGCLVRCNIIIITGGWYQISGNIHLMMVGDIGRHVQNLVLSNTLKLL